MNRFFTSDISDSKAYLCEDDAYHIKNVLRAKVGEKFEVCNGKDKEYIGVLAHVDKTSAVLDIIEEITVNREPKHKYVLCQCVPKCRKIDDVVRHATELGMCQFYPVISERVNIKNAEEYDKTDRLRRIVTEAAKQSKRMCIPLIEKPLLFKDIVKTAPADALKIIAWEEEQEVSLKSAFESAESPESVYIMVGPEGGLSREEVQFAAQYGWISVTLGKRILRTETAPLALIAAAAYHFSDLE